MEELTSCPVCGERDFAPFLKSRDYFLTNEEYEIVECGSCGLKFVNPRPDSTEIGRYYESPEYISHDAKNNSPLNLLYRSARRISIRRKYNLVQKLSKGKKLLDIGCGTGEFLFYCKEQGFDVKGIEPGEKPRTFAHEKYKLEVHEEQFLDKLTNPEFDVITMWHVLEHVHRLQERIEKIRAVIKTGGTIIIAVPNAGSWDAMHYGKYWAAYDLPRHIYHFTQNSIKALCEKHKLEITGMLPMKLDSYYISLLSEKYSTGKQNFIKASLNGFRSNNFAKRNQNDYSSLIYLIRRDDSDFKAF